MELAIGSTPTGMIAESEVAELQKALTAGYGTDVAGLSGGGALRVQSLDKVMQSTIQENSDFKLFNRLSKPKAGATVDEWTEQNSIGGFLGGSTNTETGIINDATGGYNRRVGLVKYLMTRRQVSLVTTLQNAIADAESIEYSNGALQLLSDAEFFMFEGDSAVVPTEFDGIYAQMVQGVASGQVDGTHVIDAQGQSLASINLLNKASATIRGFGNFGKATDIFMSMNTQADFDNNLDPAFRVALSNAPNGGVMIGAPVVGIRTSGGNIATNDDVFIRDDNMQQPFEVRYPPVAISQAGIAPASVAITVANDVASQFGATQAGNYFWLICGVNANGQSTGFVTAQTAVAAGKSASLAITGSALSSANGGETGYVLYRSRQNGGNVVGAVGSADGVSDFREMCRVARAGQGAGGVTTYVDQNRDIPGTSKAYVLNLGAAAHAINWRQLLPMLRFNLYPTNSPVIPWAQLLFGYLRITKRKHFVVIKNILPANAAFRPFNV